MYTSDECLSNRNFLQVVFSPTTILFDTEGQNNSGSDVGDDIRMYIFFLLTAPPVLCDFFFLFFGSN